MVRTQRRQRFRHKVEIQHENAELDANGQPIPEWTALYRNVGAQVIPVSGQEYVNGRIVEATTQFVIETRQLPGVTPKMRVCWDGMALEITSVLPGLQRKDNTQLHCKMVH